jgi:hypothetical protein
MNDVKRSIIHNFYVYGNDFYAISEYDMKMKGIGWNGSEIKIIPLYEFVKRNIIPNGDLSNLHPFDIIRFEDNRAYDSYLVIPLRVKNKLHVELNNIDPTLKKFVLSYGLIPMEFDCSGDIAYIPPEGIEAIEQNDIHFFDSIEEMENLEGIIVDHIYIKNNFSTLFENKVEMIGEPFEYDKIAFIWITNQYKLTLNDASDDHLQKFENSGIIIPMPETEDKIDDVQLIHSVIKDLPENRPDMDKNSFHILDETNNLKTNEKITSKSKLSSKKKDQLIEIINKHEEKIDELETTLHFLKIDNDKMIEKFKTLKDKALCHEYDSIFLKNNVSNGMDNIKQYLHKIQNEMNKIKQR